MSKHGTKTQKIALGLLLAAFFALLGHRFIYNKQATGLTPVARPMKAGQNTLPPKNPITVKLDLLAAVNVPVKTTRNIFSLVYKPPVVAPPPRSSQADASVGKPTGNHPPPPPPPRKSILELEAEKARADMANFRFIGFIARPNRTDLFLTLDEEYFVASMGDALTKGYYIKNIGKDYILIGDREHSINGEEVEVRIKADFEGEGTAVSAAAAGYVGAAGGSGQNASPGQTAPPSTKDRPQPDSRRPGGKRAPPPPPRGVTGSQTTVITPPANTGNDTSEEFKDTGWETPPPADNEPGDQTEPPPGSIPDPLTGGNSIR